MGQRTRSQQNRRLTYHREDEVARLILSLAQWNGDGAPVRTCERTWREDELALTRDMRKEWRSSMPVVMLGVEAGRAKAALSRMPGVLRMALWTFHVSSLTVAMQARDILGISRDTYHRRLVEAHPLFMESYEDESVAQVKAAEEVARSAGVVRAPVAATSEPLKAPRILRKQKNA